ncbi:MAG: hypothetical protein PHE67_02555 [Campylobacterales bacterium]|nr:hypothetical protein [Campylobacterales bacterium]
MNDNTIDIKLTYAMHYVKAILESEDGIKQLAQKLVELEERKEILTSAIASKSDVANYLLRLYYKTYNRVKELEGKERDLRAITENFNIDLMFREFLRDSLDGKLRDFIRPKRNEAAKAACASQDNDTKKQMNGGTE